MSLLTRLHTWLSSIHQVTKEISVRTKMEVIQILIVEEVVTKRDVNIRAFWKGLFDLGYLKLCRDWVKLTKPLFVHCEEDFTRYKFLALVDTCVPPDSET